MQGEIIHLQRVTTSMANQDAKNHAVATQPAPNAGEGADKTSSPEMVPAEQVKAALDAAADFKDRLLRTMADMENLRKRTEREVSDARTYGIAGFARDVLQVA